MAVEVYLGNPPAHIVQWIKDHSGPAQHEETWYKYAGDTEWRTTMLGGIIALIDETGEPSGQIDNPRNIIAIEIGTGTQENPVTDIGYYAFFSCSSLTSVTIPDCVTSIGDSAFWGCSGLMGALTIPNSVTSSGDSAFWDCTGLTSVTIPEGVTNIWQLAFSGCSGLTSVTFLGKTLAQVQGMDNYSWGIDPSIIRVA